MTNQPRDSKGRFASTGGGAGGGGSSPGRKDVYKINGKKATKSQVTAALKADTAGHLASARRKAAKTATRRAKVKAAVSRITGRGKR
ncbi:hypothetical protein PBI_TERROR_59 [Mycobacterium phage Terror]|uniref:Uncharacterized protein n=1 Tax=Mycobacterium phage Taheera TaxID=1897549 RepID=A0A1D8EVU3_9CAUD|nr:hypothetical protein KDW70_gp59 [Mycobacterium phage Taheera]AOT25170.1 hypothetical protein PBI_TAHEERA_59 [Mycobacterium phage Taheera]AOT25228.1 hypothetical protein PBI_TERROR_59 [Mycobacterium phage Terror]